MITNINHASNQIKNTWNEHDERLRMLQYVIILLNNEIGICMKWQFCLLTEFES